MSWQVILVDADFVTIYKGVVENNPDEEANKHGNQVSASAYFPSAETAAGFFAI